MLSYTYRYNRMIKWFKDHPISKESYPNSEYHHIIPKSCGGSNSKENIVLLPTRWHYIVHCWLPLVYAEQEKYDESNKMLYAWQRFQNYRESFRDSIKFLKEDSILYQQLRKSYIDLLKTTQSKTHLGSKNGNFNHHWWKDPNDKTKTLSIKEGNPVPEGWVRGRWQLQSENTKCIINNINGFKKYIKQDLPIPEGWHVFEKPIKFKVRRISHKQHKPQKEKPVKIPKVHSVHITLSKHCKWCGAEIIQRKKTCKHPEICCHMRIIPKMIQYFGFDETSIGSERFYEEYNKIKDYLYDLYFVQKMSLDNICKIVGYKPGPSPFANFMKSLFGKGTLRSFSDSVSLSWRHRKILKLSY